MNWLLSLLAFPANSTDVTVLADETHGNVVSYRMKQRIITFCLASMFVLFVGDMAKAEIIMSSDFEDNQLNSNNEWGVNRDKSKLNRVLLPETHSAVLVSSPVRCGTRAVRFEVRQGDKYTPACPGRDCGTRPRAQLSRAAGQSYTQDAPPFSERWYGFSAYVPNDWIDGNESWVGIFDVHKAEGGRIASSPLSLHITRGAWTVNVFHGLQDTPAHRYVQSVANDKDKWTDWVFHVKWDARENGGGFVEAWRNGARVVNYKGPIGIPNVGGYVKIGPQYSPNNPSFPRIIYFDEIKIGDESSSYSEVAPGGAR